MENSELTGQLAERAWDGFCAKHGIESTRIPVSKKHGEKRPDRLTTLCGVQASVEIKAITENKAWDEHLAGAGGQQGVLGLMGEVAPANKRVCWQLNKSSRQHSIYAVSKGIVIPSITVLVDLREEPGEPLGEFVSWLVHPDNTVSPWQHRMLCGVSHVVVLAGDEVQSLHRTPYGVKAPVGVLAPIVETPSVK